MKKLDDKEKYLFVFNGFIWITLISGVIIYYQLIPDIISSLIVGIIIAGLTYLAIFGINVWRKKNKIQKLKDEKKESKIKFFVSHFTKQSID